MHVRLRGHRNAAFSRHVVVPRHDAFYGCGKTSGVGSDILSPPAPFLGGDKTPDRVGKIPPTVPQNCLVS
jgi:hypothetical protein